MGFVTYFDDLGVLEVGVLLDHLGPPDGLVTEEGAHGLFGSVLVPLYSLGALLALGVAHDSLDGCLYLLCNQMGVRITSWQCGEHAGGQWAPGKFSERALPKTLGLKSQRKGRLKLIQPSRGSPGQPSQIPKISLLLTFGSRLGRLGFSSGFLGGGLGLMFGLGGCGGRLGLGGGCFLCHGRK